MKLGRLAVLGVVLGFGLLALSLDSEGAQEQIPFPDIPRMDKKELKKLLGRPGFVLLDCRPQEQWRFSSRKLPGAIHENPMKVESWAHKYPKDKLIIIYCA